MTKKDYELIAKAIKEVRDSHKRFTMFDENYDMTPIEFSTLTITMIVDELAKTLKENNPKFNPTLFKRAINEL